MIRRRKASLPIWFTRIYQADVTQPTATPPSLRGIRISPLNLSPFWRGQRSWSQDLQKSTGTSALNVGQGFLTWLSSCVRSSLGRVELIKVGYRLPPPFAQGRSLYLSLTLHHQHLCQMCTIPATQISPSSFLPQKSPKTLVASLSNFLNETPHKCLELVVFNAILWWGPGNILKIASSPTILGPFGFRSFLLLWRFQS